MRRGIGLQVAAGAGALAALRSRRIRSLAALIAATLRLASAIASGGRPRAISRSG